LLRPVLQVESEKAIGSPIAFTGLVVIGSNRRQAQTSTGRGLACGRSGSVHVVHKALNLFLGWDVSLRLILMIGPELQ